MNTKQLNKLTRADILKLPERKRDKTTQYSSLLVFPAKSNHESGWSQIIIAGCQDLVPIELVTTCSDDLSWEGFSKLRIDCTTRGKMMHFWSNKYLFEVGPSLSSITIKAVRQSELPNSRLIVF